MRGQSSRWSWDASNRLFGDGARVDGQASGRGGGGGQASSRRSVSVDPLMECSMRSTGTPAMSQWGRETVYAGKERAITPSPDGLVLPSLEALAPPNSRQFLEEKKKLYLFKSAAGSLSAFDSPPRAKDSQSSTTSTHKRFINVMQKTVAYDPQFNPHSMARTMTPELARAIGLIETKVRDHSEGMMRRFRYLDPYKTGMITKETLREMLETYNAIVAPERFDDLWNLLDVRDEGHTHFHTFISKCKHGTPHKLFKQDPSSPPLPGSIPSMHRSQYVSATEHGAHALHGKGGTRTVGSVLGEVHFSDHITHQPRYLNVFPFHTGITGASNPAYQSQNVFQHDQHSLAVPDPSNATYISTRNAALTIQNSSEGHTSHRQSGHQRDSLLRQNGVPFNDNGWHGWRHGEKAGNGVHVRELLTYQRGALAPDVYQRSAWEQQGGRVDVRRNRV